MRLQDTTVLFYISPTITPTPVANLDTSFGWIAAPVLLVTILFALSAAVFICVFIRRINRKTMRVRPQTHADLGRDLEWGVWYANSDVLGLEPEMNEDIQGTHPEESAQCQMATGLTYDKVEDISAMYAFALQGDNDIVVLRVPPSYPPAQNTHNSKSEGSPHSHSAAADTELYRYERLWSPEDS